MIGEIVSHYKILEKLGGGGMGVVYKAEDIKLKRQVALKFLPHDLTRDPIAKERFILEAQTASSLENYNICNIHEIDETKDGQLFICMAYYEGDTLKNKIEKDSLSLSEILDFSLQISRGLNKAHTSGIIHRDIKPANVIITHDKTIKILDFGLAKLMGMIRITKTGAAMGTIHYMSPEQACGKDVDHRTDIWSLGVVIYEMLTGQLPFKGAYDQAVIYSILNEEPANISVLKKDIPAKLRQIITKCLKKDPDERYQSMEELYNELQIAQLELISDVISKPGKNFSGIKSTMLTQRKILVPFFAGLLLVILFWVISNIFRGNSIPEEKHLAILPFNIIGADSSTKAFADGLVEILTSKLTQIEQFHGSLWVIPSSEIRNQNISSVNQAWETFKVPLTITGSFQNRNDLTQITLNLIDSENLHQISSRVFTFKENQSAQLQDSLTSELAQMLNIELRPESEQILGAGGTYVSDAYKLYLQAKGYLQHFENLESINKAIILFEKSVFEDDNFALAFAGLGEAYWRKYQLTKDAQWINPAKSYAEQALKLNDDISPVYNTLGMIHSGMGQYKQALMDYQKALEYDPINVETFRELAKTYEAMGNLMQAELTYKKAINLRPQYWANYNYLGVFYYKQAKYNESAEQFKKVVNLMPDNIRGYNNLGASYFNLEKWNEAIEMFEASLKIKKNYVAYSQLGTLYFYQGRYSDAANMYREALNISGDDFRVWGMLAESYYWSDQKDNSLAAYQKAIDLAELQYTVNPKDANVQASLAGYYAKINNHEKAETLLQNTASLKEYDVDVIFKIASVYEELEKRNKALDWIKLALEKGYSPFTIDHYPGLKNLRSDERYKKILSNIKN
jgi:serine/threonine protein kinase/tetratricopeptide (TPR) repeat protein